VLDLEKEKDSQAVEILNLKKRVKKLERQRKSSISHLRRRTYKQVESSDGDLDEEDASKQGRTSDKIKLMFQDSDFDGLHDTMQDAEGETVNAATTGVSTISKLVTTTGVTIGTAEPKTPATTTTVFDDEDVTMAMAQTLLKMYEEKSKEKVVLKDAKDSSRPVRSITTLQPLLTIDPKDQGKDVLVKKPKKPEKVKRRDQGLAQIKSDAELAQRLHEEELAEQQKRIQDFKPMDYKEGGSSTKKTGRRLKRTSNSTIKKKSSKKPKVIKEQESVETDEEAATDYGQEKEELRIWLAVVPDKEETVDPEILSAKLVMKRFEDNALECYNLLLWGDLKIMFKPNAEDEVWMEKKVSSHQGNAAKDVELEAKSTMAFELHKFIKSQLEE
nr:hypothetical protein [Tanacetum cinerariifolium]